jgi:ATP-dependent Lon protease
MPGRIIEALIQAKVKNPLILLDEIDKVSRDYRSDTSSALLEVLDSQQNSHFRDHYVEIPVDLSQVLFIATANDLSDMPRPLLDRMEVIEVNSYTANEKLAIAQQYLVPRQLGEAGLKKGDIRFGRKALKLMIDRYTREAGVRSLERTIGHVCRKAVTNHLMEAGAGAEFEQLKITEANLSDYLGREKYQKKRREDKPVVGIVTGLAWTAVGGDTLLIEVNSMKGTGKLELTGQMGDVMQESARIAMSCARSIADADYGMDDEAFEKLDFHIHIPDGAVKKDGPSAGITMTVALLSVMTGMKVLPQIAMTGEITLKGRVLPVGGLKEKLLAANVAGIRTVLVPSENRPDIEELDDEIIGRMKIEYVDDIRQAVRLVLR